MFRGLLCVVIPIVKTFIDLSVKNKWIWAK